MPAPPLTSDVIEIFRDAVVPVFLVAGIGFVLQRRLRLQLEPIGRLAVNVLVPCLIFTSLFAADLAGPRTVRIALFSASLVAVMVALVILGGRLTHADRVTASAVALVAAFPNVGNFGLPLVQFAYGPAGLEIALLILAMQSIVSGALIVTVASAGRASPLGAVAQTVRQPVTWAIAAAVILNLAHVALPHFLTRALALPGQAAIPTTLLFLGMQIGNIAGIQRSTGVLGASALKLVVAPLIGLALALALGAQGLDLAVLVVASGMPSAVFTVAIAAQYDVRPRFVSDGVIVTTLLSMVTITALLTLFPAPQ